MGFFPSNPSKVNGEAKGMTGISLNRTHTILGGSNNGKYMAVEPKIRGTPPKWMVKIMEPPIYEQMDDLGG